MLGRYLAFNGTNWEAAGGWDDFVGSAPTVEEAKALAEGADWGHIVDSETQVPICRYGDTIGDKTWKEAD